MPDLWTKAGNIAQSLIKGKIRVNDPTNIDSQVSREDMVTPDSEPAVGDAKELITLGNERFEESRNSRYLQNARIFSGIAMFQGRQYDYWDEESGSMKPIPGAGGRNPDFDERMMRSKWNIVRVLVERIVARVMATDPDAWAAPQTDSEEDKQAAQIMRAVNSHCAYRNKRKEMMEEAFLACVISTTSFIEVGWDASAYATVAIPSSTGQGWDYKEAQIGDVVNNLMLCIDAYPDPNCSLYGGDIHKGAYFIKRCTRPLSYIQDKWGKTVTATAPSSTYGYLEQRLEWIAGESNRDAVKAKDCTDVTEVWEKPTKRYPNGRYWCYSADNTMLYAGKWPYDKNDKYPFVALRYQKNQASVWGLNGVDDIKPIQIDLNDLATMLRSFLQWSRPGIMLPDTSEVSPENLNSPAFLRIIPYAETGGQPPKYIDGVSPGEWIFKHRQMLIEMAEYIAGVRDFNSDAAPPPTSGFEFELRVEQEKSRLAPAVRHVQNAEVELMEWDGALYRQFGTQVPRIMGLDDKAISADGNVAAAALIDLRALKNGNTRVVLQPGSGQSKSPAAQEQRLDEIVKNLANTNMTPALAKFYLSSSQSIRSDKQVDDFIAESEQYFASQAQQAMQVQQMKGDQAQQQIQSKAQVAQAQAQIDQQTAEAEAAIKVHAETQVEGARAAADQAVEEHRVANASRLEAQKFAHDVTLQQMKNAGAQAPKTSIAAKLTLGSQAAPSAEKMMGLDPDTGAEIKELNAKPSPQGAPDKKAPPKPKRIS